MENLINSELRYRRLFEATLDGILILDAETGVVGDINPYLQNLLGYSREEFIDLKLSELGIFTDIKSGNEVFEEIQKEEYIRYDYLPLRNKNGCIVEVEFISNGYLAAGKKMIQCNIRDITARKQAENTLQESEIRYRRLFESAKDGILILDAATGMIDDVNPYLIKMLGYSREEFVQKKLWEVGAFRDIEANKEAFETLQEDQYIRYEDMPLKTKDGHFVDVEFISNVYLVGGKKVIQCNIRDITERKQAESIRLNLAAIVESSNDAIMSKTLDGTITSWNSGAERVYGYSAGEAIGQSVSILIPADRPTELMEILSRIEQGGKVEHFETVRNNKVGGRLDVSITVSPIKNSAGKVVGSSTITRDITAQNLANEDLRSTRKFLQSVQDALSAHIAILDDAGNIVHVNSAWREFGDKNGLLLPDYCIGTNYLKICDSAIGLHAEEALLVANAIRKIGSGGAHEVLVEYPCHSIDKQRWFVARITRFESNERKWIVVAHENITERKQAEIKIQRQLEHITALSAIDRIVAANFDLNLSLSEILTHVTMELGMDAADILIFNPSLQMLEFGVECGFRNKTNKKAQVRLGESYAGRVALERQLIEIRDLKAEPDTPFLRASIKEEEFICYIGVPLIAKGQVKGVLEVFHRTAFEPDTEWLDFFETLAGQTAIAIENAALFQSLQRSNSELTMAYDATIEGWSHALDLRDKETEWHTQRVTEMAVRLGRVFGLSEAELVQVRWGALLHDIGKMGVSDNVLHKPGPLTIEERAVMMHHPTIAYEMLAPIRYLRQALDIPRYHHEKWDGSGYPDGLKGTQIPLFARIFAVVDVWDALSSNRPYRSAWTEDMVREHIRTLAGHHFDPQVVDVFLHIPK